MSKTVKIAEFKAHLSKYLRAVREGHEVVIHDRDHPIARVVPVRAEKPLLEIIKARVPGGFKNLKFKPLLVPGVDPLEFLLADRRKDRSR
jgi:prevent-host-death family protein